ncbi:MAG: 6-phosphogluconolactonase [Verrucomicrobiota bacterium]
MSDIATSAGKVRVLSREESFAELAARINALAVRGPASVGLSGGSTPKAFYAWAVRTGALTAEALARIDWHVSDERCVPLTSDDSNFGHAARGMLDPLGVPADRRFPWPVELAPAEAAAAYEAAWAARSPAKAFDLCVLGLGDDSHIASLWPRCPLIGSVSGPRFVATEWPGRGWRLTITEAGLAQCGAIVVLVNGAAKATALREIACGEFQPARHPGQTLRAFASRVTWLAEQDAAAQL